jgi:zinc transport system substrate-binding protein
MVSVLPQVYFVERIGGDKVQVEAMIPPGFSPATYDPSPEQLIKLQEAEFYFRIGKIAFEEAQMDKLAQMNKGMRIVDTSQGITFEYLAEHSHEEDGDDRDHESESGVDPHIWLSPRLVKIQAEHIYEALAELAPENQEYFLANYNNFIRDLDDVDSHLETAFAPMKGGAILVFHPAFGYLANQYGFEQRAIEIEGKDPSPEHLKEIIDQAIADDIKVIFVQKQFSTKSASAVAEAIGGTVVQIDPLAQDYLNNLEEMAGAIVNNIK